MSDFTIGHGRPVQNQRILQPVICGPGPGIGFAERDAEERVIRAALGFDAVMKEFDGDMSACGEHLDSLFTACDTLRKARDAAFADGGKS